MSQNKKIGNTHFGYQPIAVENKSKKVKDVFNSVAENYDLMNDLMSFSMHRLWKNIAIDLCHLKGGYKILDLAGGTGDLTKRMIQEVGPNGHIILGDINYEMLKVGKERMTNLGKIQNLSVVQTDAENLSFPDNFFDRVIIGFGLRNVTRKYKALQSIYKSIKPGGYLIVLEFSKPYFALLSKIYDIYSFHLLPKIGSAIAKDESSYRYLAESIRMHPDQETLRKMMINAGYCKCEYHNLTGGIVAIHKGYKVW